MKIANPTVKTLFIISNNGFIASICLLTFQYVMIKQINPLSFQNKHPHLAILTEDIVSLLQFSLSEEIYCQLGIDISSFQKISKNFLINEKKLFPVSARPPDSDPQLFKISFLFRSRKQDLICFLIHPFSFSKRQLGSRNHIQGIVYGTVYYELQMATVCYQLVCFCTFLGDNYGKGVLGNHFQYN